MSPEPDEPAGLPLFDQRNYRRAKATLPGHGQGIAPRNKGKTLPAEIIPAEQVRALVDACPKTTPYGLRLAAFIAVLYRTGMKVSELLKTRLKDVDLRSGHESIRAAGGKNLRRRRLGLDSYALPHLTKWLTAREGLPGDLVFCVVHGPTAGRAWNVMGARHDLRRLAPQVRDGRVHPEAFRLTCAAELIVEQWPLTYMQAQLGLTSAWSFTKLFPRLGIEDADDADVAEIARFRPEPS
jgi:integrase/recombinase XerC